MIRSPFWVSTFLRWRRFVLLWSFDRGLKSVEVQIVEVQLPDSHISAGNYSLPRE
jgi:hypothetical protein